MCHLLYKNLSWHKWIIYFQQQTHPHLSFSEKAIVISSKFILLTFPQLSIIHIKKNSQYKLSIIFKTNVLIRINGPTLISLTQSKMKKEFNFLDNFFFTCNYIIFINLYKFIIKKLENTNWAIITWKFILFCKLMALTG